MSIVRSSSWSRLRALAGAAASFTRWGALAAVAAACTSTPSDDITGPYTGHVHRFVVDGYRFAHTNKEKYDLADDLDGDGSPDNQLGGITATLAGFDNLNLHAAEMIASGVLASTFEIQADDLETDDAAGVWYYGADGAAAVPVGGAFVEGVFESNRTRTTDVPGAAIVHLPLLADADPTVFQLEGMQLRLVPDGHGGYDAFVQGLVRAAAARDAAYPGIVQLLAARPQDHRVFWKLSDGDFDGVVTRDELDIGFMAGFLAPDIERVGRFEQMLSVGFALHLSPCPEGRCHELPVEPTCFDRVRNGDETDVDCGGTCGACPGGATCAVAEDCQAGACDGGLCAAPRCDDGLLNGFESALDCGGSCSPCDRGAVCEWDFECASERCDGICR